MVGISHPASCVSRWHLRLGSESSIQKSLHKAVPHLTECPSSTRPRYRNFPCTAPHAPDCIDDPRQRFWNRESAFLRTHPPASQAFPPLQDSRKLQIGRILMADLRNQTDACPNQNG